ncbi:MAG: UDP-N-acetylglucosamine 2-epimerase [Candidatus Omnitrophota bacterium]
MIFNNFILKSRLRGFLSKNHEKVLLFININKNLKNVVAILNYCLQGRIDNVLLIFFNMEIPACANEIKFKKCLSEDYLTVQDYEDIDNYVFRSITKNWYNLKEARTMLEYNSIKLGNLVEYEFKQFLIYRIKNLEVIKKAVNQHNPSKIISLEDTGELNEAVRLIGRRSNIPSLTFSYHGALEIFIDLAQRLRARFSDFSNAIIDSYMRWRIMKENRFKSYILIDPKILNIVNVSMTDKKNYLIQSPVEKGLKIRFRIFKNYGVYLPYYFSSDNNLKTKFKNYWKNLKSNLTFRALFNYKDISYWEIIEEKLAYFITVSFPKIVKNIEFLKELDKAKRLRLIMLRSDARELEKTIALTANKLNIPTFSIQHGVLAEINGAVDIICDRLAVWGRATVEWYRSLGQEANKCVITGNPKFESLYNERGQNELSKSILDRLKLDSRKIILFAAIPKVKLSSYYTDDRGEVLMRKILEAVKMIENVHLIIKVHPYDNNSSIYRRIINESKVKNVTLVKKENIYDLINVCQALIVPDSTTGLEAIILDKPLIYLNLTKRKDMIPYVQNGVALGVYKAQDIYSAINDILDNPQTRERLKQGRKEFIYDYAYKIDGQATNRVISLIEETARN